MPKISYSLAIAFVLHIFILVGSTFLIDNGPSPFLVDPKNLINVQLGNGPEVSYRKGHSREAKLNLPYEKSATKIKSASENGSSTTSTTDYESVTGSGGGSRGDSYDFATFAVRYKDPIYPRLAIKRELQGNVTVKVSVTAEGNPSNIEILKSSGHDLLDRAAIDAMSGWRFLPRTAPYFVEKNIVFQLKN
jgi:TonB family protein